MPFCSWCFSSRSNRNDDGTGDDADTGKSKGPKKSKKSASGSTFNSAERLFDLYAEASDPQTMTAEGFERLCGDADIPMDGARPLLLAWQLNAKELGSFSRDEWTKGLEDLQ